MNRDTFERAVPTFRGMHFTRPHPGLAAGPAAVYAWADEQAAALIARRTEAGGANPNQTVTTIACPECAGRGYTGDGLAWADVCDNPGCRLGRVPAGAQMTPTCPICHGYRVVRRDLPVGHPEFGRSQPCPCTRGELPVTREVSRFALGAAGVPPKYHHMTLSTWQSEVAAGQSEEYSRAFWLACDLVAGRLPERAQGRSGLMLMGKHGRGKSGLAAGAFQEFMARDVGCRWISFGHYCAMLNDLRSRGESDRDTLRRDIAAHVLVIDDVGSQGQATDHRMGVLKEILEGRAGRPTIITTMQTFDALAEQFGDHNVGRMIEDYEPITLDGRDMRLREARG